MPEYGIAWRLAEVFPDVHRCHCLIFAGSYRIATEGITALGVNGTWSIVRSITNGTAPAARLAAAANVPLSLVRVDCLRPVRDARRCAAMTRVEFRRAFETGQRNVRRLRRHGCHVLAVGEVGAGNTTAASAALALLTGTDPHRIVGRGSGVDGNAFAKKKRLVGEMVRKHLRSQAKGLDVLRLVGGKEMVAVAGAIESASASGAIVVLDGLITAVAALALVQDKPSIGDCLVASHRSTEPGHRVALRQLKLRPTMDMKLACGQAYGALLLLGLGRLTFESFARSTKASL